MRVLINTIDAERVSNSAVCVCQTDTQCFKFMITENHSLSCIYFHLELQQIDALQIVIEICLIIKILFCLSLSNAIVICYDLLAGKKNNHNFVEDSLDLEKGGVQIQYTK